MKNLFILFAYFFGAVGFGQQTDCGLCYSIPQFFYINHTISNGCGYILSTANVNVNANEDNESNGLLNIRSTTSIRLVDNAKVVCSNFKIVNSITDIIETDTKPIDKFENITISAEDIGKPASYNWYDENGELVYEGKDFTIENAVAAKYNLQVIDFVDGINNYKEVELIYKPNRLIAMYPNPANQLTTLNYKLNEADSAYILVASYYGTNSATNVYMVNLETNETTIDVGNFNTGLYLVALVVNNNIADMKILSKN